MARPVLPDPTLQTQIRELVARVGVNGAARTLDMATATVGRLASGAPVTPGTVLFAIAKLSETPNP